MNVYCTYIDYTMMCACFFNFFICILSRFGAVKLLQFSSTVGFLFDGKVNLVGAFERLKFEIPTSFQKWRGKQHNN